MVKTRIICTLGPASSSETVLRKMMRAGMDVGRLNFSHSRPRELLPGINLIRSLNRKYRRRVRLLGDLQGHRIRIGGLAAPLELKRRQVLYLVRAGAAVGAGRIPFDYRGPLESIKTGQPIFLDDGNLVLEVTAVFKNALKTRVVVGGRLKGHKGVNIPDAKLDFGPINPRDVEDILFCAENQLDYLAQSFVRSAGDIMEVRKILGRNSRCRVIAKIENREGVRNIDEIIEASDGIMIARGDLGVSLPIQEIPILQKRLIRKCNQAGKFVITATQMLESMTENPRPTRAEVTDVANSIIDGTDYVMLSAESAVGKYPVETVAMMNGIIKFTEGYLKAGKPGR
ncbi:MAG TPA: pyruvate kinase [bacterium]|uniref:Pyruvate kinase n=1 Tax=candidate division TA06 bacterium ADurb.Bin417 TaxID=1852828 RepID=A0A1V5MK16_UNCT6|nr:MAG: Pyruvate kinase [candidate division TA06 bacterium ADurb.Bin417]HNQ34590.1 pyruvate kinase [bacterium]HNS48498.1 pyruvate kinase [bacterium]